MGVGKFATGAAVIGAGVGAKVGGGRGGAVGPAKLVRPVLSPESSPPFKTTATATINPINTRMQQIPIPIIILREIFRSPSSSSS